MWRIFFFDIIVRAIGCVAGASVVYFLCQGSLREYLRDKLKKYFSHREAEIQKNLTFYMLFIRLLPGFPFAIANLLPALFTVSFFDYFWTTVVGILPSTLFLTQVCLFLLLLLLSPLFSLFYTCDFLGCIVFSFVFDKEMYCVILIY